MQKTETKSVIVPGRIVWINKDLYNGAPKTDQQGQPKMNKQGEPMREYTFGLAVPKESLTQENMVEGGSGEIWAAIHEQAYAVFPSRQTPPNFAWKYKDGDTDIDPKGLPYSARTGYKDNIVFALSTTLIPKFFIYENGSNLMVNEGIDCGDYVNVQVGIVAHLPMGPSGTGNPGLYLNPMAVQLLKKGEKIVNTPNAEQIFGGQAPALPSHFPEPQTPTVAPMPLSPVAQAVPMQAGQGVPNFGVLPQAHQPQVVPQAAMPGATVQMPQAVVAALTPQVIQPQAAAMPAGFPVPGQQ